MNLEVKPIFFATPLAFRQWLEKNHHMAAELFVGFYKVKTGKPSITWSESVDQAICFGWIDGVRKSIDETSYYIRFTPRRPNSIWSAVNIKKVEELTKKGLMQPPGIAAYQLIKENKSKIYSYEREEVEFSEVYLKEFSSNKKAWDFFQTTPPSYQKPAIHWVMGAKREETQAKRLNELIKDSEAGLRVKHLRR